jgi:Flp pilus assembly protein TadD
MAILMTEQIKKSNKTSKKLPKKTAKHIEKKISSNSLVNDLYEKAFALQLKNYFDEAELIYKEILALEPNNSGTLTSLGTLCIQTNRPTEAENYLKKSLSIETKQPNALNNLGTILNNSNLPAEAADCYEKAIALDANYTDAIHNLGLNLYSRHQFSQATQKFLRLLEIHPQYPDAHNYLGLCFTAHKEFTLAEKNFNAAISLSPNSASAHLNLGLVKLLQGDFECGLPLYEWRWHNEQAKNQVRHFNKPVWIGTENIAGKTILLHPEQGFGDYIQFCRYAFKLEEVGANIVLEVQKPLLSLIKSLSSHFTYAEQGKPLPAFDFHCPIASLPLIFNTRIDNIATYKGYLKPPPDKKEFWQKKLGKKSLPRIGIAWSGAAIHKNDWKRSLPVHFLTSILRLEAEFHLLQKETKPRDWQILALNQVKTKLINHDSDLHDFSDTAALIDEMDLVISVDTSIAHLTGALCKPLWLLISYLPDFRWLLDRDDSPWYPSAKLFRQTKLSDWKDVISQIHFELELWLKQPNSNSVEFNAKITTPITTGAENLAITHKQADKSIIEKGLKLHRAKQYAEAEEIYQQILIEYPNDASTTSMLGTMYLQQGKNEQAEVFLKRSLSLSPNQALAYCNLGVILSESGRKTEAIDAYEHAIAIKPNLTEALSNLGGVLAYLEQNERAIDFCKRAIEINPNFTDAYLNLAIAYYKLKQFDDAELNFNKTISLDANNASAHLNLAFTKLLQADFEVGLPLYEWRWQDQQAKECRQDLVQPLWLGEEDIKGKTIFLHAEQGLGDCIQFCRYAFDLEKLGAKVILGVQPALLKLTESLSSHFSYVQTGMPLPKFDFHCPMASLPLALNTRINSIPAKVPYLTAPSDKLALWGNKLGKKTLPRVGIVWSGTALHKNDYNRSVTLKLLSSLLQTKLEFHLLQKEIKTSDKGSLALLTAFSNVHLHQQDLHDFTDTAALINQMDLVISVDTSVAHLAGALGKPVWILLQFLPDFRWLLDREDSPWYPTARLFRQTKNGNWPDVIVRLELALKTEFNLK